MMINIKIEFNDDGTATIRLPEGKTVKMDAMKAASFTEKLAKGMGEIVERHVGHHHDHVHDGPEHEHTHEEA